ncbi:MAG: molybdopterin-dependent oxidoreductase, partial [Actinobacteria bacterium]|nr:molybdopterin-dependent oxidoreductase [Actinomycetota bacterium]
AQRGHGAPQPRYAFESQMDMIATDLGMDPAELRLLNARQENTLTTNELKVNTCGLTDAIRKGRELSSWDEKRGKLPKGQGIGMACGGFLSGHGYPIYRTQLPHSAAVIKVSGEGDVATLYTGAVDIGQGSDTVLAQMAAQAMGMEFESMRVIAADTDVTPHDFGAYASRQTLMAGWAVKRAGEEIRDKVLDHAAEMMRQNPDTERIEAHDLDADLGMVFVKDDPETMMTFAQVAYDYFAKKGPLIGSGKYSPPKLGGKYKGAAVGPSPAYSWVAQVSQVTVDEETGQVMVTEVWDIHDCGKVINPQLLHAQVDGALFMGMGEAMYEAMVFDAAGKPLNANLGEYRVPTALDVPHVVSALVDTVDPEGPWGAKEVGEGATVPTMGCYANAIYDAIGVRIYDMPLTPEKVWRAIQERKRQEAEAAGAQDHAR